MIELSIIIPIYNTDIDQLKRCLHSIETLYQIMGNRLECILVDDGSEDYINQFFYEYGKERTFYKYIKKENGGAGSARNCGIEAAGGEFILFVDADDAILPQMIEGYLRDKTKDLVFSDLVYIDGNHTEKWAAFPTQNGDLSLEDVLERIACDGKLNGPVCKLIKRSFLQDHQVAFCEQMIVGEDADFLYSLLEGKPEIAYYPETTYSYFFNGNHFKKRSVKAPLTILSDYERLHKRYKALLSQVFSDQKKIDDLHIRGTENYIKLIFNFLLDICSDKQLKGICKDKIMFLLDEIQKEDADAVKYLNRPSRIRFRMLRHQNTIALLFVAGMRRTYLRLKK